MDYKVNLEKFSGPLDLLLSLIEDKRLAINDIYLSQVTDQFLEYLKNLKIEAEIAVEYKRILADFLIVASRLILIKSYSLLPNLVLNSEEKEEIKDFKKRLEAYKQIKEMGREIGKFARNNISYFSRESYFNLPIVFYPPRNILAADLRGAYELFFKNLPSVEKLEEQSLERVVTIEEKINELKTRISAAVEASFASISSGTKEKIDVILTFLALLMLFRNRILMIDQNELFGDIKIKSLPSNQNG